MGLVETEGIILRNYGLAEADKIVVLLTQKQGVIKGVARGAKKLKSRFGGSLEPFTNVQIQYYQKEERELVSIRQIDLLKSYFEKTSNLLFLQKFSYLAEILLEFLPLNDPNEKIYRMVKACLESSAVDLAALESTILYFEIWLLRLNGYLPNWNICDQCRRTLDENEGANIQANFQLMCASCRKTSGGLTVTGQERQLFYLAQALSPEKFIEATRELTKNLKDISIILKRIISNIVGKEVTGERVMFAG